MNRSAPSALFAVHLLFLRGYAPGMNAALRSWLSTLGWAAYLACSWTWCIGMFLPVLLVQDYGMWAFAVFAAPNVLGAAAMGWVLRNPESAIRIKSRHAAATKWFSGVTVLFQEFFLAAVVLPQAGDIAWHWAILLGGVVFVAMFGLLWGRKLPGWRLFLAAAVAFTASAAAAGAFISEMGLHQAQVAVVPGRGLDLLFLAPACTFGFLLCPYLDRTFLRARANLGRTGGKLAFILGFVGLFLPLILFTLVYTPAFIFVPMPVVAGITTLAGAALVWHMGIQLIFTIAVHQAELPWSNIDRPVPTLLLAGLAFTIVFVGLYWLGTEVTATIAGISIVEVIYRVFMSFYGLIFPAYVWLCMIPSRGSALDAAAPGEGGAHSGIDGPIGRRKLVVLLIAVAIAAPMYALGFIERNEVWLLPGLAVVLLSRAAVPGGLWLPLRAKRER